MTEPTNDVVPQVSQEQASLKEQFAFHAAMAFGEQPPVAPTPNADQPIQPSIPAAEPDTPPAETTFDEPDYLKQNFGWDTREAALAELNELRALKQKPQTAAEIAFANEQSKKIYDLLREDKVDEVMDVYQTQKRLNSLINGNVSKETAPDIIKLGMELSNKLLTKDEIEFQYRQEYGIPKEPVQRVTETDEEFEERKSEWNERVANIEMKKIVAAKMAIPQLEQLKTKIELPNINPPAATENKEYEEWKASNAKAEEIYRTVTVPAINALKESDLQMSVKVDDPNNQMQFEVSVLPDSTDLNAAKNDSLDFYGWVSKTFYDDKGNFNAAKLNKVMLLEKNFDKYAQSIARQAVNAERKRVVAKESGGGVVRDFNITPEVKNALQQEADRAFAV